MKNNFSENFKSSFKNELKNFNIEKKYEDYILNLLCDYASADFFHNLTNESTKTPLLFSLYEKAVLSPPLNQFNEFRNLGDVSLFVSGMFPEYISRKKSLVNINYYISMGQTAYSSASLAVRANELKTLFSGLSGNFEKFVSLLQNLNKPSEIFN